MSRDPNVDLLVGLGRVRIALPILEKKKSGTAKAARVVATTADYISFASRRRSLRSGLLNRVRSVDSAQRLGSLESRSFVGVSWFGHKRDTRVALARRTVRSGFRKGVALEVRA